ncbi:hypothetical protein CALCODRAFT_502166 [Calocera cornea HHB12733]|uniref:F-box domain-containing protein n=1 Tax=Calocera cornea HHB12733 TaxID=1353952 RepID=A0A165DCZ2_9BASI|nr:hypothetical protein CALCODRAFT_502166 [Calocera cornea HHB12733]
MSSSPSPALMSIPNSPSALSIGDNAPVVCTADDLCREDQLDELTRSNAAHNARLPVARLPDDVLQTIFEINSQRIPVMHSALGTPRGMPYQMQVSHVCRHWRRLALQTATLWAKFAVDSPNRLRSIEHLILKRTKGTLLDILIWDLHRFLVRPGPPYHFRDRASKLTPELALFMEKYLPQISALSINGCDDSVNSLFMGQHTSAQALVTLRLTWRFCPNVPDRSLLSENPYTLVTPNLHSIQLNSFTLPKFSPCSRMPTTVRAIRYVETHRFTMTHLFQELACLTEVKALDYVLHCFGQSTTPWPAQKHQLPRLSTCQLECPRHPECLARFVQLLSLPNLRWLSLPNFGVDISGDSLLAILQCVPMLAHLSIHTLRRTILAMLHRLVLNADNVQMTLLPRLKTLDLMIMSQSSSANLREAIERLARARCHPQAGVTPLEKLSIYPSFKDNIVENLESLGLTVRTLPNGPFTRFPALECTL